MAGIRDKPANLRRGIAPIRGGIVDELNELSRVVARLDPNSGIQSGLGTRLARELNRPISILNARVEAQTGRRGPVVIAKQTKKPIERKFQVAADFNDQPITGIGFPEKGSDAINLDYFRRFLNCDWFEKMFDDCIEEDELARAAAAGAGILPWFWGVTIDTPQTGPCAFADLETNAGRFHCWSFILEEAASFRFAGWYLNSLATAFNPDDSAHFQSFALYDTNRTKVFDFGGFDALAWNAAPDFTLPQRHAVTATSLDAGEYYLGWHQPFCIQTWSTKIDTTTHDIMNGGKNLATAAQFRDGWEFNMDSVNPAVFPDTLPSTPEQELVGVRIPLIFFSET